MALTVEEITWRKNVRKWLEAISEDLTKVLNRLDELEKEKAETEVPTFCSRGAHLLDANCCCIKPTVKSQPKSKHLCWECGSDSHSYCDRY